MFLDDFGVGVLTNFTLELREVVAHCEGVLLHYHLGLNPLLQAVDVDDLARSLAVAR